MSDILGRLRAFIDNQINADVLAADLATYQRAYALAVKRYEAAEALLDQAEAAADFTFSALPPYFEEWLAAKAAHEEASK